MTVDPTWLVTRARLHRGTPQTGPLCANDIGDDPTVIRAPDAETAVSVADVPACRDCFDGEAGLREARAKARFDRAGGEVRAN